MSLAFNRDNGRERARFFLYDRMHSERVAAVVGTVNFTSPRIIVVIIVDFHREAVCLRKNPRRPFRLFPRMQAPSGRPSCFPSDFLSLATDYKKNRKTDRFKKNTTVRK